MLGKLCRAFPALRNVATLQTERTESIASFYQSVNSIKLLMGTHVISERFREHHHYPCCLQQRLKAALNGQSAAITQCIKKRLEDYERD